MSNIKKPREIILINKNEFSAPSHWDIAEKISKIISLIGIPLLVAFFGVSIQEQLSDKTLDKEYVSIAVSILSKEKTTKNSGLRKWAVSLLNHSSPIRLTTEARKNLMEGKVLLSAQAIADSGWAYWQKGDYSSSAEMDLKAAHQGNIFGQKRTGLHYQKGLGVDKDYIAAVYWHKKAIEQGDAYSAYYLAEIFFSGGFGISRDITKAYKWIIIAKERIPKTDSTKVFRDGNLLNLEDNIKKRISTQEQIKAKNLAKKWLSKF